VSRRLWVVLLLVIGALGFLVFKGLGEATTYFRNADEAVADRADLGTRRFRLQGTVVPGTVVATKSADHATAFDVEFNCKVVHVRHTGAQAPPTFKQGIPVVLEGRWAKGDAVYESDTIIVKHTSEYKETEADRLQKAVDEACPGGAT
jgi:cytochrome c-type biogenesis protein CcmE